jgi:hypothetical protein
MFSEKQKIELATAERFLEHYNVLHGTKLVIYRVAHDGEVPDVLAQDASGLHLGIEVTITEDRPKDIASALGRSDHKSGEALRAHLARVQAGQEELRFNTLTGNVLDTLIKRIKAKLLKRYGPNTALVVRDISPIPWLWDQINPQILARLKGIPIPFDRGIWLVDRDRTIVFNLYPEIVGRE